MNFGQNCKFVCICMDLGNGGVKEKSDISFEFLMDFWILTFYSHGGRSGNRFSAPPEDFAHWCLMEK